MLDLSRADRAKKHDGIGHPGHGNQDVDRPLELGIFLGLGVTQGQADRRSHNDQLPGPEGERSQRRCEQARLARTLHHVIAGGKQAATTERKNHRVGVQWSQAPITKPGNTEIEFWPSKLGGDEHAHQHANHPPDHGHDRKLTHNRVVVVRSHCFWRIHRAPRFITGIVLFK